MKVKEFRSGLTPGLVILSYPASPAKPNASPAACFGGKAEKLPILISLKPSESNPGNGITAENGESTCPNSSLGTHICTNYEWNPDGRFILRTTSSQEGQY